MRQFALVFAPLLLLAGISRAQPAGALEKASLEKYVRHLFVWGPQVDVKVSDPKPSPLPGFQQIEVVAAAGQATQAETFHVSADGMKIVRGVIYDANVNPFDADRGKIKTDAQPSFGPAGAPVEIIVYSDFQCGFCKQEAEMLRKQVASTYPDQVRVFFKDFPLEAIHPWAKPAAIAGRCIYRQKPESFWDYHDQIFQQQAQIDPVSLKQKVMDFGKEKGLDEAKLGACIDSKETEPEVDKSMAEGRALAVNATPTVFINGRRLGGAVPWPSLKSVIDHEIEYAKSKSDRKCCEVKIPTVPNQ